MSFLLRGIIANSLPARDQPKRGAEEQGAAALSAPPVISVHCALQRACAADGFYLGCPAMSIASLTTLAAVRDSRAPTRADVGKKPPKEDPTKEERAKLTDLLVTAVPTELVAPYTAAMALIVGLVDEPTKKVPVPDQLEPARWIIFGFLVLATATAILRGKRSKGTRKRAPVLEVATGLVAAVGWAFALPDSPLTPYLDGKARAYVPVIVAFGAVALIMILGGRLKEPAKT